MSARFCHNCGNPLPENAKFCGGCGTPVISKPVMPKAPVVPVAEPVPEPDPVEQVRVEEVPAAETPAEEPAIAVPSVVFTLDALDEPVAPPKPAIFSLDSLPVEEASQPEKTPVPAAEPEPIPEPVTEAVPAVEAATAEPTPVVKPKKQKKAKKEKQPKKEPAPRQKGGWPSRSPGRTVLAVLLCVLMFVWSFAVLTLVNVRLATTGALGEKTINAVVTSMDLTHISAVILSDEQQDPEASLADWIAGKITENYQGRVELSARDLKEFWEESSVPAFLAAHLNECVADVYAGSSGAEITAEEIQTLLQADLALIDEIFDEQLTETDIANIAQAAVDSGVLELVSARAMKDSIGGVYSLLQIGLSWWVIGVAAVILVLLILLLGKINGSVLRTVGDTGITLMVMSAIWCVGGLLILAMPDLWNAMFYSIRPVGAAIGSVLTASLISSAIVFGAGTLLLLIKTIGKAVVTKPAKAQA